MVEERKGIGIVDPYVQSEESGYAPFDPRNPYREACVRVRSMELINAFSESVGTVLQRREGPFSVNVDGFELSFGGLPITYLEGEGIYLEGFDQKVVRPDFSINYGDIITVFLRQGDVIQKRVFKRDAKGILEQLTYQELGEKDSDTLYKLDEVVIQPHMAKKEDIILLHGN